MSEKHPGLTTNKFVNIYKNPGPAVENVVKGLEMLFFHQSKKPTSMLPKIQGDNSEWRTG